MDEFLTFTVLGLCTAGVFAVAASGLVLTFTTTGIFNFAHGAIGMVGAFTFWQLHVDWGLPSWVAVAVVLGVVAPAFGAVLELVVVRGLEGASEATRLVSSVAVLAATVGLGLWIWSPDESHPIAHFWEGNVVALGPANVSWHAVFSFAVAVAVAVGLRALLYTTRAGITMRAAVDDRSLAGLNGVRTERSSLLAWAIGCSLAALAGILVAPDQGLSHLTLTLLIVNAYAAALIGRLRSLPYTFLGAVILGLADSYGTGYLPKDNPYLAGFRPAIPVIVLFVVLLVLPQSRLRGHSAARSRERFPVPTWRGSGIAAVLVVAATAGIAPLLTDSDALTLTRLFGFAVIALSLVPLVGYGGQISLCQMSFAGIGAIVMAHHGGGGDPFAVVLAAGVAGAVGALVAVPTIRLSGVYLALATGAFAVVLDRWIFALPSFDVGPWEVKLFELGTVSADRLRLPGVDVSDTRVFLVELAVVFVILALGIVALRRSRFGDRLLAFKDSQAACATLGIDVRSTRLALFAGSAALSGAGGAIYAGTLGTVSPERFGFFESLPLLLLTVVGGIGSPGGALFAAIALYGIPVAAATFEDLRDPLLLLPGLAALGLGRNPNGVVRDLQERFVPLIHRPSLLLGMVAALGALVLAGVTEAGDGWVFGGFAVVVIFGAARLAETMESRGGRVRIEAEPLEWAGVERPFTAAEIDVLEALGSP